MTKILVEIFIHVVAKSIDVFIDWLCDKWLHKNKLGNNEARPE